MSKILSRTVVAACILFVLASTVNAQPLFHTEHEWSMSIVNRKFGIARQIQELGHWQQTVLWLGGVRHRPETNIHDRAAFLLPGLKAIYVTHTVSLFVYQLCTNEVRLLVPTDRWVKLVQRLSLPYFPCLPRIVDAGE